MDLIYLIGLVVVLVSVILIILTFISDSDSVTFFAERFGKNPGTELNGKVVWVTGASSGIGESLVWELAKCRAKIVLSARRKEELERVKNVCLQINPSLKEKDLMVLPLDMVDLKSHEPALEKILGQFGKLDILISNAGRYLKGTWHEIDLAVDKELFEVNVFSVINMNRLVVKHFLQAGGGQIAVVSSLAGKAGLALSGSYSAAKHALQGYFNSLRMETYGDNIDVTIICPGPVETPIFNAAFTHKHGETTAGKPLQREFIERRITAQRCAQLSLVAIANRVNESWMANLPTLPLMNFVVHFPVVCEFFMRLGGTWALKRMKNEKIA